MISDRWVLKYMRMAHYFGQDDNRCYSRQVGCIIVDLVSNRIQACGMNGPPSKTPSCDSEEYLRDVFCPALLEYDPGFFKCRVVHDGKIVQRTVEYFVRTNKNCRQCPRKLIGCKSGELSHFCSCAHAEANAISGCTESLGNSVIFVSKTTPCITCAQLIIRSGIRQVYHTDDGSPDYQPAARWLLRKAGVRLYGIKPLHIWGKSSLSQIS